MMNEMVVTFITSADIGVWGLINFTLISKTFFKVQTMHSSMTDTVVRTCTYAL